MIQIFKELTGFFVYMFGDQNGKTGHREYCPPKVKKEDVIIWLMRETF